MQKETCRLCLNSNLYPFLDLGHSALSDNFLNHSQLKESEIFYPLAVNFCRDCGFFQLSYVVPPEIMFNKDYPYDSSTTKIGRDHFTSMAFEIAEKFKFPENSLAIDIGSNAGVLLSGFKTKGFKVLGVEPSSKIAEIALKNDIETIVDFFSIELTSKILKQYGKSSIITATNVFAHIDDLENFVNGVKKLLNKNGIFVIEAPYLVNLIENLEYDTIYHEHLSYISLKPLITFFEKFDLEVFHVEKHSIHGGTMRYFIGNKGEYKKTDSINNFLKIESNSQIYSESYLDIFSTKVHEHREKLMNLLYDLKKKGKKIVGISAPAKGNTLLNFCKIDSNLLDYLTEKNPLKINKFSPGMHIQVNSDEKLLDDMPDYALILAWNFADEIIKNNHEYQKRGGKFILPIPDPKII